MPFTGVADPADLSLLTEAVDTFCLEYGIADAADRNEIAARIVHLFLSGFIDRESLAYRIDARLLVNVYPFRKRAQLISARSAI
jgi:hypothetical protein